MIYYTPDPKYQNQIIYQLVQKVNEQEKEIISLRDKQPLKKLAKGVSSWLPLMDQN